MIKEEFRSFVWQILLLLIFLRPFFSEILFFAIGFWYILIFIFFIGVYLVISPKENIFSTPLNLPVLFFIISLILSIRLSRLSPWSILGLFSFIPNLLIFYVINTLSSKQKKQLVVVLISAASIISIYAIYQYFIGFRYIRPNGWIGGFINPKRVFATFLSPNLFASYIMMMLFLAGGLLIAIYRRTHRISRWLTIALCIIASSLLLTKSVGGLLAFIVTLFLFVFCLISGQSYKKININVRLSIELIILVGIFIIFIRQKLLQLFDFSGPDNPIAQRIYYWITSINIIKDYFIFGTGWGFIGNLFKSYQPALTNYTRYSHNVFLQITSEMGLLGLISFSWLVTVFLKNGLRIIKINDEYRPLKVGLLCSGCSFLLHNFIDISFYFGQVALFWWIILGLLNENI